ncbi:MAG: hypothetical protein QXI89_00550 [Candidatus Anstonellales archaeon]
MNNKNCDEAYSRNVEVIRLPYFMFSSVRRKNSLERVFNNYFRKKEIAIRKQVRQNTVYFNSKILAHIAYILSYYGAITTDKNGKFRLISDDEKARQAFNALMEPSWQSSVFLSHAAQIEAFSSVLGSLYMIAFLDKIFDKNRRQFRQYVKSMSEAFSFISSILNKIERNGIEAELMYSLPLTTKSFTSVFSSFVYKPKVLLLKVISNNREFMYSLPESKGLRNRGQWLIYNAMIQTEEGKSRLIQIQ